MSDKRTHFKNETVRCLARSLKVPHHFTIPHTPWSYGAVERLGIEVLRSLGTDESELCLDLTEWPGLVPLVQSGLNNAPSAQRRNMAPITIFMGAEPFGPISSFMRRTNGKSVTPSAASLEKALSLSTVWDLFEKMRV